LSKTNIKLVNFKGFHTASAQYRTETETGTSWDQGRDHVVSRPWHHCWRVELTTWQRRWELFVGSNRRCQRSALSLCLYTSLYTH